MDHLLTSLLTDSKVQGVLIAVASKFIATKVNQAAKQPLGEELSFWIHPVYLVLSALAAGLGALQTGSLQLDDATVNNFLTVLTSAVVTHKITGDMDKAKGAIAAKNAVTKE